MENNQEIPKNIAALIQGVTSFIERAQNDAVGKLNKESEE
jgi:hypothetical protein